MQVETGQFQALRRRDLGAIRARKIAMHALRERGELRRLVQTLSRALSEVGQAPEMETVRSLAVHAIAEANHTLWRMRQLRRAAFGRL